MQFVAAYMAAFSRCYPQKSINVVPVRNRKRHDEQKFAVIIDSDRGDILLTEKDMRSAVRSFNRGKTH